MLKSIDSVERGLVERAVREGVMVMKPRKRWWTSPRLGMRLRPEEVEEAIERPPMRSRAIINARPNLRGGACLREPG